MTDITVHVVDDGAGRLVAVAEADTAVRKVAMWTPVTRALLDDAPAFRGLIDRAFRRLTHPWEFPDPNPMPSIDPVPWFTRWQHRWFDLRLRLRRGDV